MIHPPHTLDLWHAALNDHRSLMSQPDWHCDLLRRAAAQLLDTHAIDETEYLELLDLTTAAQAYANEATANQWFRPNRLYAVEHQGAQVGRIEHGGFMPSPGSPDKFMAGLIRHDEQGQLAMLYQRNIYAGSLTGNVWTHLDGTRSTLRLIGCRIHGREYPLITEPEHYRLALDRLSIAAEEGDRLTISLLAERIDTSPLSTCKSCGDRFEQREGCESCGGIGLTFKG